MTADLVFGRSILRWRGQPIAHSVEFRDAPAIPGYRPGAQRAVCTCGWHATIDGGHSDEDRARLARQHATGVP